MAEVAEGVAAVDADADGDVSKVMMVIDGREVACADEGEAEVLMMLVLVYALQLLLERVGQARRLQARSWMGYGPRGMAYPAHGAFRGG